MLAAVILLAALASFTALALRVRRRPLPLAAAIALGVLVAWNTLALNVLSLASAVSAPSLAGIQAVPLLAFLALRRGAAVDDLRRGASRLRSSLRSLGAPALLVVPLLGLAAAAAVRGPPNTWDAMTYHLGRVAHWLQNGSVFPFRTHVSRQNVLGPGAEYLLLELQGISSSDFLAGFVQWGCFVLVAWSVPSLARLAGAPRRVAPWIGPLTAGAPMLALQASSTQNDLVASVMTVALVAACTPFLHGRPGRWRASDVALLGAVGAAAVLVKVSSLVVAAPVILMAVVRSGPTLMSGPGVAGRWGALAASLALTALISAPYLAAYRDAGPEIQAPYLYPLLGEWTDRVANSSRGVAHNAPVGPPLARAMAIGGRESAWWPTMVLYPSEDFAGNPVQMAVLLLLVLVAALRWRTLPSLPRASVLAALFAWVAFHAVFRENRWFARLQTPLFAVAPALMAAAIPRWVMAGSQLARLAGSSVAWVVSLVAVAHGAQMAVRNQMRPALDGRPPGASRGASYYVLRPDLEPEHDAALNAAERLGCRRIGLFVTEDSYDYPLTWRAMRAGLATRHVFFDVDADWPCVTFSDRGAPPGDGWLQASEKVFVSARALPAERR